MVPAVNCIRVYLQINGGFPPSRTGRIKTDCMLMTPGLYNLLIDTHAILKLSGHSCTL